MELSCSCMMLTLVKSKNVETDSFGTCPRSLTVLGFHERQRPPYSCMLATHGTLGPHSAPFYSLGLFHPWNRTLTFHSLSNFRFFQSSQLCSCQACLNFIRAVISLTSPFSFNQLIQQKLQFTVYLYCPKCFTTLSHINHMASLWSRNYYPTSHMRKLRLKGRGRTVIQIQV